MSERRRKWWYLRVFQLSFQRTWVRFPWRVTRYMLMCILLWSLTILSYFQIFWVRINPQLHNTHPLTKTKKTHTDKKRNTNTQTDLIFIFLSILIYLYKSTLFKNLQITRSYLIKRFMTIIWKLMMIGFLLQDYRINMLLPNLIITWVVYMENLLGIGLTSVVTFGDYINAFCANIQWINRLVGWWKELMNFRKNREIILLRLLFLIGITCAHTQTNSINLRWCYKIPAFRVKI